MAWSDEVSHPGVFEPSVAVCVEGIVGGRENRERFVCASVFCAVAHQGRDDLPQLVGGVNVGSPAVADPCGAAQRRFGEPAHDYRHPRLGCRAHLQPIEVVESAVVFDHPAGPEGSASPRPFRPFACPDS